MSGTVGYILLIRRSEGAGAGEWGSVGGMTDEAECRRMLAKYAALRPDLGFAAGRIVRAAAEGDR